MKKDARPSWVPFAAAIGIPAVLLVFALLVSKTYMPEQQGPDRENLTTRYGQIYVVVKVEDETGAPVEKQKVAFARTITGEVKPEEELLRETDSAGFVTVTMVKHGDIEIAAESLEQTERLANVEESTRDSYELKLVVPRK